MTKLRANVHAMLTSRVTEDILFGSLSGSNEQKAALKKQFLRELGNDACKPADFVHKWYNKGAKFACYMVNDQDYGGSKLTLVNDPKAESSKIYGDKSIERAKRMLEKWVMKDGKSRIASWTYEAYVWGWQAEGTRFYKYVVPREGVGKKHYVKLGLWKGLHDVVYDDSKMTPQRLR